ncbi:MAG: TPM domain-containing protein [Sphingobium sp.]|jgi:putative membrane protein
MAKVNRLSEADHKLVSDAVAEAERGTDGEIVTIVTDLSDKYHDAGLHWAIGIMFLALALFAVFPQKIIAILSWAANGWEHEFSLGEVLPILFVLLAAKFLAVRYILAWMPLRLALTPRATKARRVHARAIQYFKVGAESRTVKKTGVLIYLSMGEHMAEIVADEAVHRAVPSESWGEAMAALIDEVRAGRPGEGMAAAVRRVGAILAAHFPKDSGDPNEIPDRLIEL